MKKTMIAVLVLALALSLLTGCEMFVPDPTQRPPDWWNSAEPTGSAESGPSQMLWQVGVGSDSDRRFLADNICSTGDTVYFSSGNLIYFADKATGICLPLCGKPECNHNDENCNAYAPNAGIDALANYNGRLYWVGRESNGGWQWHIYSIAYDGTDRRSVREFTDWTMGVIRQAEFHRGYLYRNWLVQEVEDGVAKDVVYVNAYPLEGDGDSLVILRAENVVNANWLRIQAYEDYVYIAFQTKDGAFALYRWDARAGVLETLYRGEIPFRWNEDFWVMEDGVIVGGKEYPDPDENPVSWEYNLYRFSFETDELDLLNRLWSSEEKNVNVTISNGMMIANWPPNPGSIRVMVRDFAGQTLLDTTFEDVEWYLLPSSAMTGYGMDEDYLYFTKVGRQFIAVSRDGSEIRLLWSEDT